MITCNTYFPTTIFDNEGQSIQVDYFSKNFQKTKIALPILKYISLTNASTIFFKHTLNIDLIFQLYEMTITL